MNVNSTETSLFRVFFTPSSVPVHRWSGGHIKWGQSFRIRHITTGRYLFLDEEKGLLLVDPEKAVSKMAAFCFRISKVSLSLSGKSTSSLSLFNFNSGADVNGES